MIHLDANLLIALVKPSDVHHANAARLVFGIRDIGLFFHRLDGVPVQTGPSSGQGGAASHPCCRGHPFDKACADPAGELYHLTGSHRRTRLNTIIAASAIPAGADFATIVLADFSPFVPHGLKLLPMP